MQTYDAAVGHMGFSKDAKTVEGADHYLSKPTDADQILTGYEYLRRLISDAAEVPETVPSLARVEWEHRATFRRRRACWAFTSVHFSGNYPSFRQFDNAKFGCLGLLTKTECRWYSQKVFFESAWGAPRKPSKYLFSLRLMTPTTTC